MHSVEAHLGAEVGQGGDRRIETGGGLLVRDGDVRQEFALQATGDTRVT